MCLEAARSDAVPAILDAAPPPAAVLAAIEEQPSAAAVVGALSHAFEAGQRQQFRCG
jgi:hypothetical protein